MHSQVVSAELCRAHFQMKKAEVLAQCGTWLGPKNATTLAIKEALQDLDK